jgi:serine acetyltransferase
MPNIKVSTGAVIGAGAIVTKDVPPYAIVVGNPAKIIKYRFNDKKIEELLKMKWWEWDMKKLKDNIHLFKQDLNRGGY